ncbi:MAG: RNase adapter RapZ [Actinobacteria bacterium]|nr:RNase adapter RapZ [Actinomycetota bacterium]
MTDILVVAGLSGAGRSQASADLEDMGWFVVDNLPVVLVDKVVDLTGQAGGEIDKLCLVVGNGRQQQGILGAVDSLRGQGHRVRILFLEASTRELVRRYETTRRRHPLSDGSTGLEGVIERERSTVNEVRAAADLMIDTTGLTVHQLKTRLTELFGPEAPGDTLQVSVVSFGFKHGVPIDVDTVLDVRFLPNPHWDEALRPLTGLDSAVRDHVLGNDAAREFLARTMHLLEFVLPAYVAEGRSYLTVGIGCTGGRHRSVAIAEAIGRALRETGHNPRVSHRDIGL